VIDEPPDVLAPLSQCHYSALESGVRQFSDGSAGAAAFSGKGQTLGGATPPAPSPAAGVTKLDPQVKILLALIGAYVVFWCLS
jgi:thioredoxin 1